MAPGAGSVSYGRAPTPGYAAPPQAGGSAPPVNAAYAPTNRPPRPAEAAPLNLDADDGPTGMLGAPMGPPPVQAQPEVAERRRAPVAPSKARQEAPAKREVDAGAAAPMSGSAYLVTLGALARELDAQGRGRADAAAIRLLRQRLTEWIEDVRSVGGHAALADAVEQLVQRLSSALAAGQDLAGEAIAIAAELVRYAAGGAPPPPAPKQGRAFWK